MKKITIITVLTAFILSACVSDSQPKVKLTPSESVKLFAEQTTRLNSMMPKLRLEQKGEDFLVSETGISKILDAVAKGAAGNSESQIRQFISDKQFSLVNDRIYKNVNVMYFADKSIIHPKYIKSLPDFTIESSLKSINSKVKRITDGMIPNAMENVLPDSPVVLSNVMTFNAKWRDPFNKSETRDENFNAQCKVATSVGKVPTMHRESTTNYLSVDGIMATTVLFINDYHLLIAMNEDKNVSATQASQWLFAGAGKNINQLMVAYPRPQSSAYETPRVKLSLPKLDLSSEHDLIPSMKSLGIADIFTGDANFSNISTASLNVAIFEQKIKLQADEKGAKAAAVTTASMAPLASAPMRPSAPIEFNVDHPFAFAIIKGSNPRQIVLAGEVNSLGICKTKQ